MTDFKKIAIEALRFGGANCNNCLFWRQDDDDALGTNEFEVQDKRVYGFCQAHPPARPSKNENAWPLNRFPVTEHIDSCGEWVAQEPEYDASGNEGW